MIGFHGWESERMKKKVLRVHGRRKRTFDESLGLDGAWQASSSAKVSVALCFPLSEGPPPAFHRPSRRGLREAVHKASSPSVEGCSNLRNLNVTLQSTSGPTASSTACFRLCLSAHSLHAPIPPHPAFLDSKSRTPLRSPDSGKQLEICSTLLYSSPRP